MNVRHTEQKLFANFEVNGCYIIWEISNL